MTGVAAARLQVTAVGLLQERLVRREVEWIDNKNL